MCESDVHLMIGRRRIHCDILHGMYPTRPLLVLLVHGRRLEEPRGDELMELHSEKREMRK